MSWSVGAATGGDGRELRKTKVIIRSGPRGRRFTCAAAWQIHRGGQEMDDGGRAFRPGSHLLGFPRERQGRAGKRV